MSVQFSLAQHTVPFWSPAEMIYNAAHIGYDAVGMRMIRQGIAGEADFDMTAHPELLPPARQALRDTGIYIHDIDLATIGTGRRVEEYIPYLDIAAELGTRAVVSSIWTEDIEGATEEYGRLCDLAGERGMKVYLEFVTWAEVKTLPQAQAVLEKVDRPNAGILVDSLHFYRSRDTLEELERCPKKWLGLLHWCDAPTEIPETLEELTHTGRSERLYPGEGAVDSLGILERMPEDTVIGLEIPHDERRLTLGSYEHARRCLERAKHYLTGT